MHFSPHSNPAESDVRERIVHAAAELFPQYGIKAVSMDEIARKISISKRTLYEYFTDKEELLVATILYNNDSMRAWADKVYTHSPTVLHVILEIYSQLIPKLKTYSERFHEDMLRYPKAVDLLKQLRTQHANEIKEFFKLGVEQNIFLPGVSYDILSRMIIRIQEITIPTDLAEIHTTGEIRSTVILTLIRGVCTQKGQEIFDDYLAEFRSQNEDN